MTCDILKTSNIIVYNQSEGRMEGVYSSKHNMLTVVPIMSWKWRPYRPNASIIKQTVALKPVLTHY